MSAWADQIRHLQVTMLDFNNPHGWAVVESRFELRLGAPFRPQDVQVALYCDGEEVAVGNADQQGRWAVRVEGLRRPAEDLVFEAHARLSLKRARSERRPAYQLQAGVLAPVEAAATPRPARPADLALVMPEMKRLKPGNFWMGRSSHSHRVRFSRPLSVAATPVTQGLYEAVTGHNPSRFKGPKRPVEQVSFWEALEFCNALSALEGESPAYRLYEEEGRRCVEWLRSSTGYRLPTEAEWEFCAKAGREALYAGLAQLSDLGWYHENAQGQTHPVGEKEPNEWGLYDLCGNVWEWCFDVWDEEAFNDRLGEVQVDPVVLKGPNPARRVRRGGCWLAFAPSCVVTHRFSGPAVQQTDDTGLRVVRTV